MTTKREYPALIEQLESRHSPSCIPDPGSGVMELSHLDRGRCGRVVGFHGDTGDAISRRLFDLGFAPGVEVELVRWAPLRDPMMFRVAGAEMLLRRTEAARIIVDTTDAP